MLKGIIHICPECRKVVLNVPNEDNTLWAGGMLCSNDGYRMKAILLNDIMIDRLLKDEVNKCQ